MRFFGSLLGGFVLALTSLSLAQCGAKTEASTCVPGQSIACAGEGCTGFQVCKADGKSYDECVCGSVPFPSTGPNSGRLGAACTSAASCRKGFDCITSDSKLIGGEGPSGGICLQQCPPDHDFCKGIDATSKCAVLVGGATPNDPSDDVAYCLPGCKLGTQPNELDKCRGRVDLVCSESPAGSGVGFCRPACRSNIDCGERICDLKTGLCGDRAPGPDPIGSPCALGADMCSGGCAPHGGSFNECSGVCSYGTAGCGQTSTRPPLSYYCYLDPATRSGDGDLGYCSRLCDCDKDCGRADAVCEPKPALKPKTGRGGVCGSMTYPNGAPRPNTPC